MSNQYPNVTAHYMTPDEIENGMERSIRREAIMKGYPLPRKDSPVAMQTNRQGRKGKPSNKLQQKPTGKVPKNGLGGNVGRKKNSTGCVVM